MRKKYSIHKIQLLPFLLLIIFVQSIINSNIFSQAVNFKHLTMQNGLSNNKVYTVIQDKIGFMWFGTDDGLNRYDGYNFNIYRHNPNDSNSISDNSIWELMVDKSGSIWIGTKSGILNKYNPTSEKFTKWKLKSNLAGENSIKSLHEDSKGNIWIGTYKEGLYKLNISNNNIEHWVADIENDKSLSHNYILSVVEDNTGKILVGTYNGLSIFDPKKPQNEFKNFYYEENNQNSISNNKVWMLSKSKIDSNIIWIGTANNLTKYNSINSTFERIEITNPNKLLHGTSAGYVLDEIIANENILWIDSYAGLLSHNLTSGKTERYVHDEDNLQSLINNQINKIVKDRTNVLWVATENGISYSTPKSSLFNSIAMGNTSSLLKKKNITTISKYGDSKIWVGTMNGLYLLKNINTKPILKKIPKFDGYYVWSVTSVSKSEIWVGTYGKGLKQFNYVKNEITNKDISNSKIKTQALYYNKALLHDNKKNIWIGYWGVGVARINSKTGANNVWLNETDNPKSLTHNDVWVIKEDRLGRIWIGTQGGGINLFEDKDGGIFHHWSQSENDQQKLSSNNIYSILEAKKNNNNSSRTVLWIGTNNGLIRFEVNTNNDYDIYNVNVNSDFYSVTDGLPDNTINSIVEDDKGNLWLGTSSGISLFDVSKKSFANFSTEDGIKGRMMNPESALKLDNGLMLFGSTEGLNIFEPNNIKLSSFKPIPTITDFQIFNKSVKIGNTSPLKESIQTTKKIKLLHNQNVFSFEFATLDYNSSQSINYAYKMEGFDNDWISSGNRRFVTYTNLNAGSFIFQVKSTNSDGVWSKRTKSIQIIVQPPIWKTWWFRIATVSLFLFGMYFTVSRRISKLEKERKAEEEFSKRLLQSEEKERERIASGLHDSLGQNLLVIKNRALLGLKSKKVEAPIEQLSEISDAATLAIDEVRQIAYNLHPYQLNRLGLTKAIKSKITNIKESTAIIFEEKIDSIDGLFNNEEEIHIYRIFQEITNNVVKHSGATEVVVRITKLENNIIVKIKDNGKGFNKNLVNNKKEVGGFGFQNINKRISLLNGTIRIHSKYGTEINVKIPFRIAD